MKLKKKYNRGEPSPKKLMLESKRKHLIDEPKPSTNLKLTITIYEMEHLKKKK